jgi:hypothetical protein
MSSPASFYNNKWSSNLRIYPSTARSGYQVNEMLSRLDISFQKNGPKLQS